jgi:hypothetical protein
MGENYSKMNLKNKTIKILPYDEVLKTGDICRFIMETGEEGGFNITYKPEGYKPLEWYLVEEELPGWLNKQISKYKYHFLYEFARLEK